jgi:transcription antitermination factor NusG
MTQADGAYDVSQVYCLFCTTGREAVVEADLKDMGLRIITTLFEDRVVKKGVERRLFRSVIPGYVFFSSDAEPDWRALCRHKNIYRPLCYGNVPEQRALRGPDLDFVERLRHWGDRPFVSRVYKEGTRIVVLDGPLKDLEGNIVFVDSRRKHVQVHIGGALQNVWLPYEVVAGREEANRHSAA